MSNTPIWNRPYPELLDIADVPVWMHDLAMDLEDVPPVTSGTLAARPTSSPVTPGKEGRRHLVLGDPNPLNNNIEWVDSGTGWIQIGGPIDPVAGVPGQRTLGPGSQQAAPGTTMPIVSATKPSSPVDGQQWYYPWSTTEGLGWLFRWDAAHNYWKCIGGDYVQTLRNPGELFTSTSVTNTTASRPGITVPFTGAYHAVHGGILQSYTGGVTVFQGIIVNGSSTNSNDTVQTLSSIVDPMTMTTIGARVVNAGQDIAVTNFVSGAGQGWAEKRWLSIKPTYVT